MKQPICLIEDEITGPPFAVEFFANHVALMAEVIVELAKAGVSFHQEEPTE
jgi:hypothetical protein